MSSSSSPFVAYPPQPGSTGKIRLYLLPGIYCWMRLWSNLTLSLCSLTVIRFTFPYCIASFCSCLRITSYYRRCSILSYKIYIVFLMRSCFTSWSIYVSALKLGIWLTSSIHGLSLWSSMTSNPRRSQHRSGSFAWLVRYRCCSYGCTTKTVLITICSISCHIYLAFFL